MPTPPTRNAGRRWVQCDVTVSPRIKSRLTPTSASPAPINNRTGTTVVRRPATNEVTRIAPESVTRRRPAPSGERPRMFCRYNVKYSNIAKIEPDTANATIDAPLNARRRNSDRSNIGALLRRSTAKNTANSTTLAIRQPSTRPLPHPFRLDSIRPNTRAPSATVNVTKAGISRRAPYGSRDSSTFDIVSANAMTPIGTLTRKIQRQLNPSVSAPPTTGPIDTAAPVTAPQTPNATPRSRPR